MSEQPPKLHGYFHKFMIWFAMWAYALMAVIAGARDIMFAYDNRAHFEALVIIMGVLLIALGAFIVKVRFDLAAFRRNAPKELLIVCVAAAAIMAILHFLLTLYGDDDNSHRLSYALIFACWGIALYRYYNARSDLFVN